MSKYNGKSAWGNWRLGGHLVVAGTVSETDGARYERKRAAVLHSWRAAQEGIEQDSLFGFWDAGLHQVSQRMWARMMWILDAWYEENQIIGYEWAPLVYSGGSVERCWARSKKGN